MEVPVKNMERAKSGTRVSRIPVTVIVLLFILFPLAAQGRSEETRETKIMEELKMEMENSRVIYLAGGCFWGLELLMQSLEGVIDAESGYANGRSAEEASYKTIKKGGTGFRETVKVTYEPSVISLEKILFAYYYVIDPTVSNRQGNDVGEQYQTGIYYTDEESKTVVERITAVERGRTKRFYVETGPLINFYPAEEYHQDYLVKNPGGYCHIPRDEIKLLSSLRIDPGKYTKPADEIIRESLSDMQYAVTQKSATERPFANEYWNSFERGIYVDIVTGEPLFSSLDKYESSCGWPAFSSVIEKPAVVEIPDTSHGMVRTEVRSRAGDSHLGHVFEGDRESPSGVRYCINSASLRFVPYEKMEEEGYGFLMDIFD